MSNYYSPIGYGVRPRPSPNRSKGFISLWLVLIAVLLIGIFAYTTHLDVFNIGHSNKKVAAVAPPILSQAQIADMSSQINSVIGSNPSMDIGVAIQDLNNRQNFLFGESNPFVAASISKLLTASAYLHQVELGNFTLGQAVNGSTAQYELKQMIEQSDNDAWTALNDLLTHDGLQTYAQSIGLTNYDPDQNTLTVNDISQLLGKLYKNELLNSSNTNLLLSYMQNANEDDYIVASVPSGVKVYHKAGWLVDRIHDAAIINNGKHPYVLVIFTKDQSGTYDSTLGHHVFAQITTATTRAFL